MRRPSLRSRAVSNLFVHVVLICFAIIVVYPLVWMVFLSLKNQQEMYIRIWAPPRVFEWSNYPRAWTVGNVGLTLWNTLLLTAVSVFFILLLCYFAAYAHARMRFPGRNAIMVVLVATMLIPSQVIIIPLYALEASLGVLNTRLGLILPYIAGGIPFSIFLLTAFLRTVPFELEESAFIDGCKRPEIIQKIILPLSRPGLATVIVFQSFSIWNQYFLPLVLLQDPSLQTVTLGLMAFSQQWGMTDFPRLFAALTIINVPVILLYAVFQKQFISGMTAGALKM
jgi:raffinose/stachyose/melibiose transport system permease protein